MCAYYPTQPLFGKPTEEEELAQRIANYQTRLSAAGQPVPEPQKQSTLSNVGRFLENTFDIIDRPGAAVRTGIRYAATGRNPIEGAKKGFTGQENFTGVDFAKNLGIKSKGGQFAAGLAAEIATDPLSYTTFGLGSLLKGAAKGVGGTITKETADIIKNQAVNNLLRKSQDDLFKAAKVNNLEDFSKALKVDKYQARRMIEAKAFGAGENATEEAIGLARAAVETRAVDMAQKAMSAKAGKGISFAGATIVPGKTMQDIGAKLGGAVEKLPVIKPAASGIRSGANKMFSTTGDVALNAQSREVYKQLLSQKKGTQNLRDIVGEDRLKNIAALQRGVKLAGKDVDLLMHDIISTGKQGLSERELYSVITTTNAQRKAWDALQDSWGYTAAQKTKDATLNDLIYAYQRTLRGVGLAEKNAGVLGGLMDAGKKTGDATYFPRVVATNLDEQIRKGGMTRNFNVVNQFNLQRNEEYASKSLSEINATIREKFKQAGVDVEDDFNFLETSAIKSLVSRAMTSNKVIADKEFVTTLLDSFGRRVGNAAEIKRLMAEGNDIVVPVARLNVFNFGTKATNATLAKELGGEQIEGAGADAIMNILERQGQPMAVLTEDGAKALVGKVGIPYVYAVPKGLPSLVNKEALIQIDDGTRAFNRLIGKFYRVWKPLVTSLRPGYHARNIQSSSFNNFLDLGMSMFNPETQRAAAAVVASGLTGGGAGKFKIGKEVYTGKQLRELMVQNDALNTFFLTDTSSMANALAEDTLRKVGTAERGLRGVKDAAYNAAAAPARVGRKAGNTIEEYVRATNFVAHLKQGMSPLDAADMTKKFHFDYTDITEFEQTIKKVIPFYTWIRKNFPLQVEQLLNNPAPYLTAKRAQWRGAEAYGVDLENMPGYLTETGAFPIGTEEDGRVKMYDPGLPMSDLYTSPKDVLAMLSPLVKAPLERGLNKNFLTGNALYSNDYSAATELIQDSPFSRMLQDSPYLQEKLTGTEFGRELAKNLLYAKNNAGALRDLYNYAMPQQSDKVLLSERDRNQLEGPVGAAARYLDPGVYKYYSPAKGALNAGYQYERDLGNLIQALKEMGYDIETITELKKKGYL